MARPARTPRLRPAVTLGALLLVSLPGAAWLAYAIGDPDVTPGTWATRFLTLVLASGLLMLLHARTVENERRRTRTEIAAENARLIRTIREEITRRTPGSGPPPT